MDETLSVAEAARRVKRCPETIRRAIRASQLEATRPYTVNDRNNRPWRIKLSDLLEWERGGCETEKEKSTGLESEEALLYEEPVEWGPKRRDE